MNKDDHPQPPGLVAENDRKGLIVLATLSILAGAASGLVGAVFRRMLEQSDLLRNSFIKWSYQHGILGFLLVVVVIASAVTVAAWLVRRFSPEATGSGIPNVEAILNKGRTPVAYILIPVKFVGGILAIGAGLALGREGPTVQLGATVSHWIGHICRLSASDAKILLASGAGAGLATAFNSPIAGSIFVLEELMKRFDTRITIATLGASASAIAIARMILGQKPDFPIAAIDYPTPESLIFFAILGLILGLCGVAYNYAILNSLRLANRATSIPVELRAAVIGIGLGVLAWYLPASVGGGDNITASVLSGTAVLRTLLALFALRFVLGAVSYSAGTPGGLFAPILVLGSQIGLLFGTYSAQWFPTMGIEPRGFAVTGMAAFFTAVVRAPLTGIVLVIELTASETQLLAMLAACFTAMLVPTMLGSAPIYDSLGEPEFAPKLHHDRTIPLGPDKTRSK